MTIKFYCDKCKCLFETEQFENKMDLNIPVITCTKCGYRHELCTIKLAGESPSSLGYSELLFDKKEKRIYEYSEWPGSVDDADTLSEKNDMTYKEALEYLEKNFPQEEEAIAFVKKLIN